MFLNTNERRGLDKAPALPYNGAVKAAALRHEHDPEEVKA